MIFRQLFDSESSTYTYLLADTDTKEAVLIDPVIEKSERDAKLVGELGLSVKFVMNTHVHADHITGTGRLKVNTQFSNLKRNLKTKMFSRNFCRAVSQSCLLPVAGRRMFW